MVSAMDDAMNFTANLLGGQYISPMVGQIARQARPYGQIAKLVRVSLRRLLRELGLRREAFELPRIIRLACVGEAVVQAVQAALPEFDSFGF